MNNAVVHTQRGHTTVNGATDAYIKLAGPGQMNAEGVQVTTMVLTERATRDGVPCVYQSGDILVVDARTDFATPGQVTQYTIQKATPSGTGTLALWRVEVAGAIR